MKTLITILVLSLVATILTFSTPVRQALGIEEKPEQHLMQTRCTVDGCQTVDLGKVN